MTTTKDVRSAADDICAMDVVQLKEYNANLPEPEPEEYLSGLCFSAMYAMELLTTGYGFPDTTLAALNPTAAATAGSSAAIAVVGDVNGTELTWALGAIMSHANALDWELQPQQGDDCAASSSLSSSTVPMGTFLVVAALALALAVTLLLVLFCLWRGGRRGERRGDGTADRKTLLRGGAAREVSLDVESPERSAGGGIGGGSVGGVTGPTAAAERRLLFSGGAASSAPLVVGSSDSTPNGAAASIADSSPYHRFNDEGSGSDDE